MKMFRKYFAGSLIVLLGWTSPAFAQDRHIVPPSALAAAVAQQTAQDQADRAAIKATLARDEVRAVAAKAGVDMNRVAAAIDSLTPGQLAQAAATAHQVDQSLVGGASTVTISTTTVIIALLILIIVLVAN